MKETLKDIIKNALLKMDVNKNIEEIVIEVPKDNAFGDYSSNIAMQLVKELKKSPKDIAVEVINNINDDSIINMEVAGPGFINFFVKKDYLKENINKVIKEQDEYGKSAFKNKKVNVEYVSANPTGHLHLGHARGASYGDNLTRVLNYAGYKVDREYYINDAGNQIDNLQLSVKARYLEICGKEFNMPTDGYYGKEIISVAKNIYDEFKDNVSSDDVFRQKGLEFLLDKIKSDLKDFRVEFDIWSSEQSLYTNGLVTKTLEDIKNTEYVYEQEGAIWLKTTSFEDEKDRVLVKSDNTNTYLLPDIAYHRLKYSRGYDILIDVLGADHHGYVPRLKAGLEVMGEDSSKLHVEILQMVRLLRSGEEVKMSKRTGNAVTINELVEEVGIDAARYFFANRSVDTQMDFDLDLATKKSNENPVYYVQYAHARINSIIKDYKNNIKSDLTYDTITSDYALNLLFKVYEFNDYVEAAALRRAPHIITNYVYELAGLFHSFYAHEKVLSDDENMSLQRINMIYAVAITIKNALNLIGVSAPEKM
jgi:arginyl-tRNA synthetase